MQHIPIIPGRGLNSLTAVDLRLSYLKSEGYNVPYIANHQLNPEQIKNNIESFVGSVEIPVGTIGPLLMKEEDELVYALAGTLEGALISSINRGAKVLSQSGGYTSKVYHQKMIRAPLFMFDNLDDTLIFRRWIKDNFQNIVSITEQYSNHAKLSEILPFVTNTDVHLKFIYQTGDASGQNMTTTCTWHAILWIVEEFKKEKGIDIEHFIIDGNGASDKKVSQYSIENGRGIKVKASCFLKEEVINRVLRTSSENIMRYYKSSVDICKRDGILGYNVNVANLIAAIFLTTGQDLGSLHESSIGFLEFTKKPDGLSVSLILPNLVIGTIGGGTHLSKQKEALTFMGCYGTDKVQRFAKIIAGFALSLEMSTYAAIVSGEFAKAHEKLGRNKPVKWLLKSEIDTAFIKNCIDDNIEKSDIVSAEINVNNKIDNGILTDITQRVNNKQIGFIPINLKYKHKNNLIEKQVLIKSKALDIEVIKGLHLMASSIDVEFADLLFKYKDVLEYSNCHNKEIYLYKFLNQSKLNHTPTYFGKYINTEKETYLFIQEYLYFSDLKLFNTENESHLWLPENMKQVILSISEIHLYFQKQNNAELLQFVQNFEPWKAKELYKKIISLLIIEEQDLDLKEKYKQLLIYLANIKENKASLQIPETIIHNDFNSRNIAIRKNGKACIYDWELAVVNIPHRDIVEFLSFVLPPDFSSKQLYSYLDYHYSLYAKDSTTSWNEWKKGYVYALHEYLITRISFYEVSGIILKYEFSKRILKVAFRMLDFLEKG